MDGMHACSILAIDHIYIYTAPAGRSARTHLQRRRRWRRGRRRWGTRPGTPTSRAPGRSGGPRPRRWRRGGPARRGRPRRRARRRRSRPTRPGPARRPPPTSGTRACAPARTASRLTTPRTRTRPAAAPRIPADHLHHPPAMHSFR